MYDKLHMQSRVFQHDLQAAKVIHSRMNQGNSLFPPDEMIPLANEIKKSRKFSRKAFELAWNRFPTPNLDQDNMMQALKQKKFKVCNYSLFRLPKNINKRFVSYWQNGGERKFYEKIVTRAMYAAEAE